MSSHSKRSALLLESQGQGVVTTIHSDRGGSRRDGRAPSSALSLVGNGDPRAMLGERPAT